MDPIMDQQITIAEKYYNILNEAIDNNSLHSEEEVIMLLKEECAMMTGKLMNNEHEFVILFTDNSTLKVDFIHDKQDKSFFDITVEHGIFIPKSIH